MRNRKRKKKKRKKRKEERTVLWSNGVKNNSLKECAGTTNFFSSLRNDIRKTCPIRFVRYLYSPRRGNRVTIESRFSFPRAVRENVAVHGDLKREGKKRRRKKRHRVPWNWKGIERGEKKMAESAASPGTVQVAANSPQQQQQQSQQQQQTQQNQQPPDISSSQLASPPITGTGTNRKRSRSSGRDYI